MTSHYASLGNFTSLSGYSVSFADKSAKPTKYIKMDTRGLTTSVKTGDELNSYVSKGAVGGGLVVGAVLFGPLGAIAGGLLGSSKRKNDSTVHLTFERDGQVIGTVECPVADRRKAQTFANKANASAADPDNVTAEEAAEAKKIAKEVKADKKAATKALKANEKEKKAEAKAKAAEEKSTTN